MIFLFINILDLFWFQSGTFLKDLPQRGKLLAFWIFSNFCSPSVKASLLSFSSAAASGKHQKGCFENYQNIIVSFEGKSLSVLYFVNQLFLAEPTDEMQTPSWRKVKDKIFAFKGYWGRPSGRRILMAILNLWKLIFRTILELLLFKS